MHIKICGIKTLPQARAAVEAGADMLGFNFYPPSPRSISPATCAQIIRGLDAAGLTHVTYVGVFVNAPTAEIEETLARCGLHLAQLSGDEPPAALAALRGRAFKAVRPASPAQAEALLRDYARHDAAPALLVDARVPGSYGGSGVTAHWQAARYLAERVPILLAGGLTPENAAAAVAAVQPWGLDTASGVESAPGVKSPPKMAAFVKAARQDC